MMKKHLFLLGFLIFSTLSNAQSIDLNTLAQGKLIDHFIIHDEEGKVFGYMHIFKVDEIDKETVEYQYVLLDKNLNISLRTNFVDKKHKRSFRVFYSCNYMGDHFILQCSHYLNPSYGKRLLTNNNPTPELIANTIQVIGYDQKEAPKEYYISGEQLMEVPEDYDDLKKGFRGLALAKNDIFSLGTNKFSGYGAFTKTHKLLVFNAENKLLWDYQFAFDKDKLKSSFTLRTRNEKFILASKRDVRNNKTWNRELIGFDLESGKNLFQIPLEHQDSQYRHSIQSSRIYGDLIYIQGFFTSPRRGTSHKQGDRLGLFQLVLDKKGNEVKRVYRKWEEMKTDFTISPEGKFDSKYYFSCSGSFTFSNGAAVFLLSPRKLGGKRSKGLYYMYSYKDFICISLDSNFELQTSQLIQQDKTPANWNPNFMYAQYINDNQGLAFFLRRMDKKKTLNEEGKRLKLKNWRIQIGTITDGQFKMDEITKETKYKERGSLSILPAKEGHLILWDESKDESEIRLERLNL